LGTDGNEEADRLAKEGTESAGLIFIEPGRSYYKKVIKADTSKKWEQRYQKGKYYHFKVWLPTVSRNKNTDDVLNISKKDLSKIISFTTDHNTLRSHNQKIHIHDPIVCRICANGKETSNHLVFNCGPLRNRARDSGLCYNGWTVAAMLDFMDSSGVRELFEG
jgi:hypothetical protein